MKKTIIVSFDFRKLFDWFTIIYISRLANNNNATIYR